MADKGGKRKKQLVVEENLELDSQIEPRTRNPTTRPELLAISKRRFKPVITENETGSKLDKSKRDRLLTDPKVRSQKRREPSPNFDAKKLKCSSPFIQPQQPSTSLSIQGSRRLRSNLSSNSLKLEHKCTWLELK